MIHERKVELFLSKEGKTKKVESSEVVLRGENSTVADLKAAGHAKLFDAEKYVKEKEEVTGTPWKEISDETLVSSDKLLKYALYVTAK